MKNPKEQIKEQLLEHIEDLKSKIENNENSPEDNEQDVDSLIEMDDRIQECLGFWYY